jgi:hypothetical protein
VKSTENKKVKGDYSAFKRFSVKKVFTHPGKLCISAQIPRLEINFFGTSRQTRWAAGLPA